MATAFIHHSDCLLHDMGTGHPESPQRLQAIEDGLIATGLADCLVFEPAPKATRAQLARVHGADYIDFIVESLPARGLAHLDPDTAMNPHSLSAALRAAGAAVRAADLVARGEVDNAFCSVRPPGHHACRARAMGFCLFNNVAVGAAHALEAHGMERVAIVDFDVHHGNGTEDIFAADERVMMVSTFQHPFYPYSGVEGRSERMINIPLPARSTGRQFREAVVAEWLPALRRFAPQMIFVSAGFDAHRDDDMAALGLVEDDYAWVTRQIMDEARRSAGGRIVSTLEGGYDLRALASSVQAHIGQLCGL
ncbi:MAG TPA: histone deacetylase family protein [Burkholderiales bacterium]|nr:histone deacetylase family protein [Burkholderiales bacterium]